MRSPVIDSQPEILVVEDDPVSRDLLVLMLQSADIRVTAACDGQEAVDLIERRKGSEFEAVFTDVNMPRMNGLSLLEWLNLHAPTTATVIMTASQERELVSASLRGGAVEFLDKPFDMRAILRVTRRARETHRHRASQLAAASRLRDIADVNQRLTRSVLGYAGHTAASVNLSTRFYSINEAGGDLVKATVLGADRIMLVLGDVSGHGLKEGFLSAYFQGIIEGMANQAADCRNIARSFNRFLQEQWHDSGPLSINTSLSACFLDFDLAAGRVSVLGCGGPGAVLSDQLGITRTLASGGCPLGWFEEIEPVTDAASLAPAGLAQLWSDGLEAHAHLLGVPPLALAYRILQAPANSLADTLLKNCEDDIVACRFEWCQPGEKNPLHAVWIPLLHQTVPGDSAPRIDELQGKWRRVFDVALPRLGEELVHDVSLTLREAVLNALDHGCGNDRAKNVRVSILVAGDGATLRIRITDEGAGFDPSRLRANDDADHVSLGLQVIRALAHEVKHSEDGRAIELLFRIPATFSP